MYFADAKKMATQSVFPRGVAPLKILHYPVVVCHITMPTSTSEGRYPRQLDCGLFEGHGTNNLRVWRLAGLRFPR
jgi:hypothetical protein